VEHGWNILLNVGKRHHWMGIEFGRVGELFQCSKCIHIPQVQHSHMSLDHIEVESSNPIEKSLIGGKVRFHICLIV
jgi:hypothetical protein